VAIVQAIFQIIDAIHVIIKAQQSPASPAIVTKP
jgi:hypothetical protein